MCELVWFRHDLRVAEQPALNAALRSSQEVVGLVIVDRIQWKAHGWGIPCMTWYTDTVRALADQLAAMGIVLRVELATTCKSQCTIVSEVAQDMKAKCVHVGRQAGFDERRRDQNIKRELSDVGIKLVEHTTESILPVELIRSKSDLPYSVYTPFRRAWDAQLSQVGLPDLDKAHASATPIASPQVPYIDLGEATWSHTAWCAGTASALERLNTFLDGPIDNYHTNRDRPDLNGTSTLSPWLAVGAISPVMCLRPLVERYGLDPEQWPEGPRVWRQELVWREFYRHVMMTRDKVSQNKPMQDWTENLDWRSDADALNAWTNGQTGFDIIDAAMIQLRELGWMHNRLRMVTAMFLTKNLMVDWRLGELHFSKHLIDYDFASNNGGWQWAASTGTDAAPYFRIFNPESQAEKFDPDRQYQAQWLNGHSRPTQIVDLKTTRAFAIQAFKSAKAGATESDH